MDSGVAALLGAAIGSLSSLVMTWIIQRHETRRKLDEALIKAGMDQWSKYFDVTLARTAGGGHLWSPEVYIFHLCQFAGILHRADKLSDKEIELRVRDAFHNIEVFCHSTEEADTARRKRKAMDAAASSVDTWNHGAV